MLALISVILKRNLVCFSHQLDFLWKRNSDILWESVIHRSLYLLTCVNLDLYFSYHYLAKTFQNLGTKNRNNYSISIQHRRNAKFCICAKNSNHYKITILKLLFEIISSYLLCDANQKLILSNESDIYCKDMHQVLASVHIPEFI